MSGGDTPKQGAQAPPPSRPSGSRFGSFMTQPVLVVALIALVVAVPLAIGSLSGGTGGGDSAPSLATPSSGVLADIAGDYIGRASLRSGHGVAEVELRIGPDGRGSLARSTAAGICAGELRLRGTSARRAVFGYTETANSASCPRMTTVTVRRLAGGKLQFTEALRGRVFLSGRLQPGVTTGL